MSRLERGRPRQTATRGMPQQQHNCNPTPSSLHDAVLSACADAGIGPLPDLPVIGEVRCPDIDKPSNNRSCWIKLKADVAHIVGHASGYTRSVFAGKPTTPDDRVLYQQKKVVAQRMLQSKQDAAIQDAQHAWDSAQPCVASQYTERKRIRTYGCRWHSQQNCLLVPLQNIDGDIQSLQRIYEDGKKLYWSGAPTKGLFFQIGDIEPSGELLIAEGYATGSTVYRHTGKPVVCAMSAGKLLPVGEAIRHRYPDLAITICGDDDRATDGNPGRTKATEAACAIGANLAMPKLCRDCKCTDFNDQANCERGAAQ
jgi:putative DNA primase/helicase